MRLSEAEKRALIGTLGWSMTGRSADRHLDKLVKKGLLDVGDGIFHERAYHSLTVVGGPHRELALKLARELGATTSLIAERHAADAEVERVRQKRARAYPCSCWACIARREFEKQEAVA